MLKSMLLNTRQGTETNETADIHPDGTDVRKF